MRAKWHHLPLWKHKCCAGREAAVAIWGNGGQAAGQWAPLEVWGSPSGGGLRRRSEGEARDAIAAQSPEGAWRGPVAGTADV
eukprot:4062660-Amphidinium_carterae.1